MLVALVVLIGKDARLASPDPAQEIRQCPPSAGFEAGVRTTAVGRHDRVAEVRGGEAECDLEGAEGGPGFTEPFEFGAPDGDEVGCGFGGPQAGVIRYGPHAAAEAVEAAIILGFGVGGAEAAFDLVEDLDGEVHGGDVEDEGLDTVAVVGGEVVVVEAGGGEGAVDDVEGVAGVEKGQAFCEHGAADGEDVGARFEGGGAEDRGFQAD